jgi:hypothetical protein
MNNIKNDNVWYFRAQSTLGDDDQAGDSISLNVDQITGFAPASRTSLYIWFKKSPQSPSPGTETQNGIVGLTITEDKNKEVMQALSEAASSRNNTFRTIGDNITNEYLHANITSVSFVHQT